MSGEEERASRPSSLLLDAPPPEREPLHFDVQLIGAPPEVEQLVNNIKQVAEDFLYHWKTFPIVLPPSRFSGPGNRLSDVIIPPPCDELDTAALDASVEPEPLSPKQLQAIRERGEFEVQSRHFPGQTHVWRVAGWLQRGRVRARDALLRHAARALSLLVVVARRRLAAGPDHVLTVRAARAALTIALYRLLDLLIGMPSMEARDLEKKIREERSRYLVAELICMPEHEEDIAAVAAWVSRAMRRAGADKPDVRDVPRSMPRVPHHYTTPQRIAVDLRLYRRDLVRRAAPALQDILDREARGWFLHFRERTAAALAARKAPPQDAEEELRAAAMREYVSRVCTAVRASTTLAALGPGVPELLADQLRAAAALERAESAARARLAAGLAGAEAKLRAQHPLLSRAPAWLAERLAIAERRLQRELRWAAREEAAHAMLALDLPQHRYFLLRDLVFVRDREPLLAAELKAATTPTRTFVWSGRAWGGEGSRARGERRRARERARTTTTRWAGWRVANVAQRARSWCCNAVFALAVVVAWRSPLSLRTLMRREPLAPDLELAQTRGSAAGGACGDTHTVWSRLRALWRHVATERARIDAEPDTGLLGGCLTRALRRAWLYVFVGGLGSAALLLLFPLCVVVVCTLALVTAALAPLWVPPLALLVHFNNMLVYDFDCPQPGKLNRWFPLVEVVVWRLLVLGVMQPIAAVLVAAAMVPLAALLLAAGAAWEGARAAWEAVSWRGVIVRLARVPHHDSVFCRRVAGPGLTAPGYCGLSAGQAAAAAAARAELDALHAWADRTERHIDRPLRDYKHFVDACFGPFSVQIAKTGSYLSLERECSALVGCVRAAVTARKRDLALPLSPATRARCRLTAGALRQARAAAAAEMRRAWRHEPRPRDWWAARGLDPDDWPALAAATLLDAFDADVLVPLEEGAACLPLESGAGARAWEARCEPPDLLGGGGGGDDGVLEVGAGAGAPRVPPPALDVGAFNPRAHNHPPLPSPAVVALLLHNRDSDNPVPLESELCADIVRALEEAGGAPQRYRGGGSDGSDSDDPDTSSDTDPRRDTTHSRSGDSGSGGGNGGNNGNGSNGNGCDGNGGRGACRWTLTGRGVRLRADLASPEDVTLDADRRGTSV